MQECWQAVDQTKALLQFYDSLIFQRVRGDVFRSAVLHFPAVLGINEEIGRLRRANDFSYILAGVVYCVRVMAVEIILPSAERDDQDEEDDRRFQQVRAEYLADGSYSVMSKMLSMLTYGKHLAMNHSIPVPSLGLRTDWYYLIGAGRSRSLGSRAWCKGRSERRKICCVRIHYVQGSTNDSRSRSTCCRTT